MLDPDCNYDRRWSQTRLLVQDAEGVASQSLLLLASNAFLEPFRLRNPYLELVRPPRLIDFAPGSKGLGGADLCYVCAP